MTRVVRTQIHLGDDELELLDEAAARSGAARSELIRRAIRAQYGVIGREERLGGPATKRGLLAWTLVHRERVRCRATGWRRRSALTPQPVVKVLDTTLDRVPVTEDVSRHAGELAQRFRPSRGGIDDIDYVVAATADILSAGLLTSNVRHFPMFEGLTAPY